LLAELSRRKVQVNSLESKVKGVLRSENEHTEGVCEILEYITTK